ncbi:carbohydrate-binding module family 13 protein [Mycena olivaceomarginata]|nr:carbohydrate-binding module family 13 protein [Mycena olivaceomarginata]
MLRSFCSTGIIPNLQTGPSTIQPVGHSKKCLDIIDGSFRYNCNGSQAQKWIIKRGKGSVQVAGMSYCLNAGSSPGNGVGMKIWQCFDDLAAQTWFYDGVRKTFNLYNEGQCLDLTDGDLTNGHQTQTWQCTVENTNQLWDI